MPAPFLPIRANPFASFDREIHPAKNVSHLAIAPAQLHPQIPHSDRRARRGAGPPPNVLHFFGNPPTASRPLSTEKVKRGGGPAPLDPALTGGEGFAGGSDADGQGLDADQGEEAGCGGLQGRVGVLGPGEEAPGIAIKSDGTGVHRDDPIGRGEAALEAVLGQEDGYPPLLIEAT